MVGFITSEHSRTSSDLTTYLKDVTFPFHPLRSKCRAATLRRLRRWAFPRIRTHSEFHYYLDNRDALNLLVDHGRLFEMACRDSRACSSLGRLGAARSKPACPPARLRPSQTAERPAICHH